MPAPVLAAAPAPDVQFAGTAEHIERRTSAMRKLIASTILLVGLSACANDSRVLGPPPPAAVVGRYVLVTYAGQSLPVTIAKDSRSVILISADTLTIDAKGKYSRTSYLRAGPSVQSTRDNGQMHDTGSLTGSMTDLRFRDDMGGATFTGRFDGGTLTMAGGQTLVFAKI
jgi:hypothetical protein